MAKDKKTQVYTPEEEIKMLKEQVKDLQDKVLKYEGIEGWEFKGDYSDDVTYRHNNLVQWNDGTYILRSNASVGNPDQDASWEFFSGSPYELNRVRTVNNIGADERGNIDIGRIARITDVESCCEKSKTYTDIEIERALSEGIPEITGNFATMEDLHREVGKVLDECQTELSKITGQFREEIDALWYAIEKLSGIENVEGIRKLEIIEFRDSMRTVADLGDVMIMPRIDNKDSQDVIRFEEALCQIEDICDVQVYSDDPNEELEVRKLVVEKKELD